MLYVIPTDTCFWFACNIYDEKGYEKIYEIKWRNYEKPLPILIKTFDDLESIIQINSSQLEYLKSYIHPFTILAKPSKKFKYPDFINKANYKKIGIRVAESCISSDLINIFNYPLFLTSANKSNEHELFSSSEIKKEFAGYLKDLDILEAKIEKRMPSDIFEFEKGSTQIKFLRKNY